MPVLPAPVVRPPFYLFNGHLQTILPSLSRSIQGITPHRERLELPDGDFLDVDWTYANLRTDSATRSPLVLLSHGLEGDSRRHYILGMVKHLGQSGFDALAWNCRSCSGEMNRLPRFYHHGDYLDLSFVINHAINIGYEQIFLVGFSMGGSQMLRYLGEMAGNIPPQIKKALAFSVPVDLKSSVKHFEKAENQVYEQRFLKKLSYKIIEKSKTFPSEINPAHLAHIRHFRDFDTFYTAPLHGFKDADDFYERASVKPYLEKIQTPTLLVNALNDPFLTPACFPSEIAEKNPYLFAEFPEKGGHVGFTLPGQEFAWSEQRAASWFAS